MLYDEYHAELYQGGVYNYSIKESEEEIVWQKIEYF